jgi:hypothetical protein
MTHGTARRPGWSPVGPPRRSRLFKPDRPRAIDRYIDYFGGRPGIAEAWHHDVPGGGALDAIDADAGPGLPRLASTG